MIENKMKTFRNLKVGDLLYYVDSDGNLTSATVTDINFQDNMYFFNTTYINFSMMDESLDKDNVTLIDRQGDRLDTEVFTNIGPACDYRDDMLVDYFETGYNNMMKEREQNTDDNLFNQEDYKENAVEEGSGKDDASFHNEALGILNAQKDGFQYSTAEFVGLLEKYFGHPEDEEVDELEYEGVNMLNRMSGYEVFYHCSLIHQVSHFLDLLSGDNYESDGTEETENIADDAEEYFANEVEFLPDAEFENQLNEVENSDGCNMRCHNCDNEETCNFYCDRAENCADDDYPHYEDMILAITLTDRGKEKLREMNPELTEDDTCNPLCRYNSKYMFFPIRVPLYTRVKINSDREDPEKLDLELIDKSVDIVYKIIEAWVSKTYPEFDMLRYEEDWKYEILDKLDFEVHPDMKIETGAAVC